MSRHIIFDDGDKQLIAGWDAPMRTFFYQLWDLTKPDPYEMDEHELVATGGERYDQFKTVEALMEDINKVFPTFGKVRPAVDRWSKILHNDMVTAGDIRNKRTPAMNEFQAWLEQRIKEIDDEKSGS